MHSLGERGVSAETGLQTLQRPSLREINAIIRGLHLYALDRNDYGMLLDRGTAASTSRLAPRLSLRRRRRVILPHRFPAWWDVVVSEPETARDLLLMVLFTGLRQSQLTTLRWSQVDLARRAVYFPRATGPWFGLPMSSFTAELVARRAHGSPDWVFPGRGRAGHLAYTQSIARRAGAKAAVPFSFSDLRRTFIAIGVSLEIPPDIIKSLLGYQLRCDTPLSLAAQVERLREPVQRIADRILSLATSPERRGLLGSRIQPVTPVMMISWGSAAR
jgi:integrase